MVYTERAALAYLNYVKVQKGTVKMTEWQTSADEYGNTALWHYEKNSVGTGETFCTPTQKKGNIKADLVNGVLYVLKTQEIITYTDSWGENITLYNF